MKEVHAIQHAKWIIAQGETGSPVIERKFFCTDPSQGRIAIASLGFFMLYVNGDRVGEEYFLPSNSLFHERPDMRLTFPITDRFTYRAYYSVYDLAPYLREGENTLEIALASGWYRQTVRLPEGRMSFGDSLGARYALELGAETVCSDGSEQFRNSPLIYDQLYRGEVYDARIKNFFYRPVTVIDLPDTELLPEDSTPDRIERRITPTELRRNRICKIYDAGENVSGFATLRVYAPAGYEVRVRFSEELNENGTLDFSSAGRDRQMQEDVYISDGTEQTWEPRFVWHGFRYVEVLGDAEVISVAVVHTDVKRTAEFTSSSKELNWLFETYLRTQLNNMHAGVPSDCPHRERLGYTGDGQLCAPSGMLFLDTKAFYRKWMRDIFDSQDPHTGHVNYTAPFAGGGGGPGGWGGAVVYVPYYYWRAFGETAHLSEYYERMTRWIDYMVNHSENGLVVRGEPKGWCLGDWCTLEKTVIPEPFVNTCLLIQALGYLSEIACELGREEDRTVFAKICKTATDGVMHTYYDPASGSFAEGIQGADAIALACGLGDERTLSNLVEKYESLGYFDTGIFGTPMLCDVLFSHGYEELAYRLLTSHEMGSFGYMMDHGATTLWEEWDALHSLDHPMFGACVHHLFTSILGVTQKQGSSGYAELLVVPKLPRGLSKVSGCVQLPVGAVSVSVSREGEKVDFEIVLPKGHSATFVYGGVERQLCGDIHHFTL